MPAAPPQQHRILRQVIELQAGSAAEAAALQAAVSRLFQRRLLPVIEHMCDSLGDAGQVQRIERLELDLGVRVAAAWRGDDDTPAGDHLVVQFETLLRGRLAEALRAAPAVATDVELVASALQHGHLPWWADTGDRETLTSALASLLKQPAAVWRGLLPADASGDPARRRLVALLDDAALAGLVGRLAADPGAAAWAQPAWGQALAATAAALGTGVAAMRRSWWCEVLALALRPGAAAGLWPQALRRWADRAAQGEPMLVPALRRALDQAMSAPAGPGPADLAPLWRALDQAWPGRPGSGAGAGWLPPADELALVRALGALGGQGGATRQADALARRLAPRLALLPTALRQALVAAWAAGRAGETALGQACLALLQQARRQGLLGPGQPGWPAGAASGPDAVGGDAPQSLAEAADTLARALAALRRATPPLPPRPQPAAQALTPTALPSTLYLTNAGLVLLWPFITRFFDRLGLIEQGRFRDEAAAERAALLLQCVASGDGEPPEFQLPLNKLLCGLPPDHLLLAESVLGDDEQAECEALLQAVIASATVLRQMSVAGFRGSFLLRAGQLSPRDGHWLLRVERQPWDMVIARFPWPVGVVRLPWMPALLQVEWPLS